MKKINEAFEAYSAYKKLKELNLLNPNNDKAIIFAINARYDQWLPDGMKGIKIEYNKVDKHGDLFPSIQPQQRYDELGQPVEPPLSTDTPGNEKKCICGRIKDGEKIKNGGYCDKHNTTWNKLK